MPALNVQTLQPHVDRYRAGGDDEGTGLADATDDKLPPSALAAEEAAAFEQLVCCHQAAVARLAHRLLGWRDREAVEDIVQDVFLIALRRLKDFRGESSVRTWLISVTINCCRSHRRRSLVRLRWLRQVFSTTALVDDAANRTHAQETSREVRDALCKLAPPDREVIVLFYLERMPAAEMAVLLGVRVATVNVRLHRARTRLKKHLTHLIGD